MHASVGADREELSALLNHEPKEEKDYGQKRLEYHFWGSRNLGISVPINFGATIQAFNCEDIITLYLKCLPCGLVLALKLVFMEPRLSDLVGNTSFCVL